jgi:glycosyltransferase involved in cell wall biosynthesis
MAPTKNITALLDLARAWPERNFVLAGPQSDYATQIGFEIDSRGLDNVQLFADVKDAQKAWLYANCEAFLFPSLTEGFGLPPLEAMQFGKPVFLSDRTCLPEIGGDAAFYWRDFAPLAMRAAMEAGLSQWQPARDEPRVRARAARFNWSRCTEEHLSLYRSLLD